MIEPWPAACGKPKVLRDCYPESQTLRFRLFSPAEKSEKGLDRKVSLDRVVEKRFGRLGPPRMIMKKQRKRRNLKASGGGTTYYNVEILTEKWPY